MQPDPVHTHPTDKRPLPALRGTSDAGEIVLHNPFSGQELVLSQASIADLAQWRLDVDEWIDMAKAAKRQVDREITGRMDRNASWTVREGGFKVEGESNAPRFSYKDAEKLRESLLKHVEKGTITLDAVDAAVPVEPERVTTRVAGLNNLLRLGGSIERLVKRHREESRPAERSVKVSTGGR